MESKRKLGVLEIVLLILALITLILVVIKIGFALWFWIFLVLWAVLLLLYFFTKVFLKFIWLFWILFIIWIVLPIVLVFSGVITTSKTSSTSSAGGLVSCTSTSSDSPVTILGYKFAMFAQPVDYSGTADDGTRTFSIKSLDAKTGEDVFFHIEKSDGGFITGAKGLIEVCNSDNKTQKYSTTADSTTTGASSSAEGSTYYMHGNRKVKEPGTYRVDGYANVDGNWKLVGRISDINITE